MTRVQAICMYSEMAGQLLHSCNVQYMVVYQGLVAEASMTAFFVNGSSLSILQVGSVSS